MREIKFRAWDKKENKMYGSVGIAGRHNVYSYNPLAEHWEKIPYEVEPMQFTGLHDKNGKEIYEGDVLKPIPPSAKKGNRFVEFLDGSFCYNESRTRGDRGFWRLSQGIGKLFEVIGNIYENPELLDKGAK